eukprot:jgi/Psemu1/14024/gm1.14024_g
MARNATKKGPKQLDQEKHPDLVYQQLELSKALPAITFGGICTQKQKRGGHQLTSRDPSGSIQTSWEKIGKIGRPKSYLCCAVLQIGLVSWNSTLATYYSHHFVRLWPPLLKIYTPIASWKAFSRKEEEEEATMPKKSVRMAAGPGSPASPGPADIHANLKRLSIQGPIQTVSGLLPYPMLSGRWEVWDHKLKVVNGYCLMRMLLHSGTKETDYSLDWVDERILKIKLKWPIFMQNALFMTGLDVSFNANGNAIKNYPEGHQVYTVPEMQSKNIEYLQSTIYSFMLRPSIRFHLPLYPSKPHIWELHLIITPVAPINFHSDSYLIFDSWSIKFVGIHLFGEWPWLKDRAVGSIHTHETGCVSDAIKTIESIIKTYQLIFELSNSSDKIPSPL